VYLPGQKLLFSGDLVLNGLQPFMQSPDMDPAGWERSLQSLSHVPVDVLVPGHGEIGPKTGLQDSLAYVSRVNALARKLVDGNVGDEMVDPAVRAPENQIPNVPPNPAHVANIKAAVKAVREKKAKASVTPMPSPVPPKY
jgi:glyoxylase-like metal-dependent hydrolase (beta-lactamase superfamily II)